MSLQNSGSPAPYPGGSIEGLVRRVQDLERTVAAMSTQLVNQGTLQVQDPGSAANVLTGKLADGTYGVSVTDTSGRTISLAALAFGITATNDGGATYQQNLLNTWVQGSMSLTVNVSTGRLLVLAGGELTTQPTTGQTACMSWSLAGPTNVAQTASRGLVLVTGSAGVTVGGAIGACYPFLHTGLATGTYTITDWYTAFGSLAAGFGPIYSNRTLIAIPF